MEKVECILQLCVVCGEPGVFLLYGMQKSHVHSKKKVIIIHFIKEYLLDRHPSQHGKTEKRLLNNWCVKDEIVMEFIKYLKVKDSKNISYRSFRFY